jgi:hypothetical protein
MPLWELAWVPLYLVVFEIGKNMAPNHIKLRSEVVVANIEFPRICRKSEEPLAVLGTDSHLIPRARVPAGVIRAVRDIRVLNRPVAIDVHKYKWRCHH